MKKQIGIYQGSDEYPTLHIIITNNAKYLKERLAIEDVDEAVGKVREWLERKMK